MTASSKQYSDAEQLKVEDSMTQSNERLNLMRIATQRSYLHQITGFDGSECLHQHHIQQRKIFLASEIL
ncbi:uncharacterized protein LOC120344064 isoform X2 [Styela clava]